MPVANRITKRIAYFMLASLEYLLQRYADKTCTEEEKAQLMQLLQHSEKQDNISKIFRTRQTSSINITFDIHFLQYFFNFNYISTNNIEQPDENCLLKYLGVVTLLNLACDAR